MMLQVKVRESRLRHKSWGSRRPQVLTQAQTRSSFLVLPMMVLQFLLRKWQGSSDETILISGGGGGSRNTPAVSQLGPWAKGATPTVGTPLFWVGTNGCWPSLQHPLPWSEGNWHHWSGGPRDVGKDAWHQRGGVGDGHFFADHFSEY